MNAQELAEALATWMTRLGLSHWGVTLEPSAEPQEGAEAETFVDDSYDHARVRFAVGAGEWEESHARLVVVHELLHLVTRDLKVAVEDVIEALPNATARALARSRFTHELEGVVDRMAAALVGTQETTPCS